ncbi:hypothetical protein FHT28_006152 [Rhizobium sp. SG570]|nr:hypothetical protein [Rhizobium sp. SG570]
MRRIGVDIFKAVTRFQTEFVLRKDRIGLDKDVSGAVLIVPETRRGQFARDNTASEPGLALDDENALAGFGKIAGGDQSIMSRTDRDDIVCR